MAGQGDDSAAGARLAVGNTPAGLKQTAVQAFGAEGLPNARCAIAFHGLR